MEIEDRIKRIEFIINGLEHNESFKLLVEEFQNSVSLSDMSWQNLTLTEEDQKKFYELKYNKLAALSIINVIENYKYELGNLKNQLKAGERSYYADGED